MSVCWFVRFVGKFNHRSYSTALCRQPFCDLSKAFCWTYWSPWSISLTVPIFLISISTHEIHSRAVFYARKTVVCVSIAQHRDRPTKVTVSAKLLATQKFGTKNQNAPNCVQRVSGIISAAHHHHYGGDVAFQSNFKPPRYGHTHIHTRAQNQNGTMVDGCRNWRYDATHFTKTPKHGGGVPQIGPVPAMADTCPA